jgi:predicted GNAT family acetyltransferase
MPDIQLQLNEKGFGAFYIYEEGKQAGEMAISINNTHLTAYHTEVLPEMEGKGLAKQLLSAMVGHARSHHLKVIPLCPYVLAQFKRHEQEYSDICEKTV